MRARSTLCSEHPLRFWRARIGSCGACWCSYSSRTKNEHKKGEPKDLGSPFRHVRPMVQRQTRCCAALQQGAFFQTYCVADERAVQYRTR